MDCPNLGNHCSVVGDHFAPRKITYRRGFGNIVTSTVTQNKITSDINEYNRLQPLTAPFGTHAPPTADPVFVMKNPQTVIAWDRQQPPPPSTYQNQQLGKIFQQDDTLPSLNNKK